MKYILLLACALLALGACQTKREIAQPEHPEGTGVNIPRPEVVEIPTQAAMPKAKVYQTSGNYNDHVFILMDKDGNIVSYPAPSDVSVASAPIALQGGWLLDRRGIADNAAFLSWTYGEYHNLTATPSLSELKSHIIPEARVTRIMTLPMDTQEAESDTTAVNSWIRGHVPSVTLTLPD